MVLRNEKDLIFTTVTTASYLPRAIVMAKSLKEHMPTSKVIACIVENQMPETEESLLIYFDNIILAKDLGFANFPQFIFQYNQAEGSNACKAQLLLYLLKTYSNYEYFVFLDSDTKVYSPFTTLIEQLKKTEIVISPHFIRANKEDTLYQLGIVHNSGVFNTGFFAVKRGKEAYKFLEWWANLLLCFCYINPKKGFWNEQKWLDLIPGLFDFRVFKDFGYNVGPWNFRERLLTAKDDMHYMANDQPLCLFHFSGIHNGYFNYEKDQSAPNQKELISNLATAYMKELTEADKNSLSLTPWSYDFFDSGLPIDKKARLIFKKKPNLLNPTDDPFLLSNEFFLSFLQRNRGPGVKKRSKKGVRQENKNSL